MYFISHKEVESDFPKQFSGDRIKFFFGRILVKKLFLENFYRKRKK